MKRAGWICGSWLAVSAFTTAQATTLFVDAATGDDANSGMSAAQPFLTVQRAVNQAALSPGPDVIQIAAGEYRENIVIKDPDVLILSGGSGVEIIAADPSKEVVYVKGGDVVLSDLRVSGGKHGVRGAPSQGAPIYLTLRKVESVDNAERGLRAVDVLGVWISGCQFLRNGTDGVKVEADVLGPSLVTLSVHDTLISDSGDDGLDLELLGEISLKNVVVENTLGDDGLSIDDTASVFIEGCAFVDSAADGIDIDDTQSVSLVSTVSAGNGVAGLQIKAEEHCNTESVRIVGSDFLENGADGVWISEEAAIVEQVRLSSVTASSNGGRGVNIVVSGTVKLSAITSENNGADDVP